MYNFTECPELSKCSPDIESIFVEITNTEKPITVGAIYRPPNGSMQSFNNELQHILENLKSKTVFILGDYNIIYKTCHNIP